MHQMCNNQEYRTLNAIHHMDVTTAFLNGELKEEICMHQPKGYADKGQ